MVRERPTHRRVLQVHTGEVDYYLHKAEAENFPEIQELDDVPKGTFREVITPAPFVLPIDWAALYRLAPTPADKLRVIARMLHLEP